MEGAAFGGDEEGNLEENDAAVQDMLMLLIRRRVPPPAVAWSGEASLLRVTASSLLCWRRRCSRTCERCCLLPYPPGDVGGERERAVTCCDELDGDVALSAA